MSTTIDERVVEMRFDNRQFEKGVSTTMSTLDKLKQKLNLTGASKGLENVGTAAKKVDLTPVGSAAETVGLKFSAMYTMADQALRNITNSAMAASKRIVSALTIDPISTGFKEYETQINAVQTILANTESKGSTIDDVNTALDQLNTYADKTIYNFTEMTRNIGTFTAAGVDLDTSVNAIQGIANLAAVSGSTSQQASTAMYQLSQALASGTVKLMDWNSVVNAGMGGEVFQNALEETARVHGVAIDDMIKEQGSFRETLHTGWLTADILTETLSKFTMATEGATEAEIEANRAKLKSLGYTDEQIEGIFKLGNTATNAATKVKTFTQLWDVMKESAQSGWAQTWELIVGDFEQAKALLTPLADFFVGIIGNISKSRNDLLKAALDNPFAKSFEGVVEKIKNITDPAKEVIETMENLDEIAKRVINMEFKTTDTGRRELLMAEGYNWAKVQNRVNEMLGSTVRHSEEAAEAELKLYQTEHGLVKKQDELNESRETSIEQLVKLTDAQLKALGFEEKEIEAFRELAKQAEKTGIPIEKLIEDIDQLSGRSLMINSFKNAGKGLIEVFNAIKDAWQGIFPPKSTEEKAEQLYNIIAAVHKFSTKLIMTDDTAEKLERTFKGLFAIVDIVATITGGALRIGFKAVSGILKYFNMDILDLTAKIGDAIVSFRDWLDSILDFEGAMNKIVPPIKNAIDSFKNWISTLKESKNLPKDIANGIVNGFGKAADFIKSVFSKISSYISGGFSGGDGMFDGFLGGLTKGLSTAGQVVAELGKILLDKLNGVLTAHGFQEISLDVIAGFINGIKDGASKALETIWSFAKSIIDKFCAILGVESPSTVFFAIGGFIIAGLIGGLLAAFPQVLEFFKNAGANIAATFSEVDFGKIFATILSSGLVVALIKIAGAIQAFSKPFEGLGDVFEGVGGVLEGAEKVLKKSAKGIKKVLNGFGKVLNSVAFSIKANAIKTLAISIAILVGAIALLTFLDPGKVWNGVAVIVTLIAALGALAKILDGAGGDLTVNFGKFALGFLGMSAALILMAIAMKLFEKVDAEKAFGGAAVAIMSVMALFFMFGKLGDFKAGEVDKIGSMLLKMAGAMAILAGVCIIFSLMSWEGYGKAAAGMGLMVGVIALLMLISKIANMKKIGSMLLQMAGAMAILAGVCIIFALMSWEGYGKAAAGMGLMLATITLMMLISKIANMKKIGSMLLQMAGAMAILAGVALVCALVPWTGFVKAGVGLLGLTAIIAILMFVTKKLGTGKDLKNLGVTLVLMASAMAILAVVALIMSLLDVGALAKGIIAVGALAAIMALMIYATKNAHDCQGNLIVMTVAIGVMAVAVAALSMIDFTRLAGAVGAMAILMLVFTLMISVAGKAQGSIGPLIVMTVAVGLLGGLLIALAHLPIESTIGSAIALGILMLAMTGSLAILSLIGKSAGNALAGVVALLALAIPLLAFVGILALMQNIQNAQANALILAGLTATLSLLLGVLTIVGIFVVNALAGVVALLALAIPLLAFVGILALMQNIQNAQANADLLIGMMSIMTGLLVTLAVVGPLALVGVAAMAGLLALMVAVGALVVGIGALMEKFPQLEGFIDTGLPILEKLAFAIGSFVGNLVSGFATGAASGLPELGLLLSQFMINAMPFIVGIKMVDASMLEGIGVLTAAIIALTAADLINALASFVPGAGSFSQMGSELSAFMINALPFITLSKLVDPASLEGIKALAEAMLILTATNLLDSLTSWLTGGSSLADFGAELAAFGPYMAQYAESVAGIDTEAVTASANAAKALGEMASNLPNSGGWLGKITGENDMDIFGEQLASFGKSMKSYSDEVTGINVEAITASAEAGKGLSDLASNLPNTGGWLADIAGDNGMDVFGEQLKSFGEGLKAYGEAVTDLNVDAITASIPAGEALSGLADGLPNSGGWLADIAGDNGMDEFGEQLKSFGEGLASYGESVTDLPVADIAASVTAAAVLASIAEISKDIGKWDLGKSELVKFGENLASFGGAMGDYYAEISEIKVNKLTSTTTQFAKLVNIASGMEGVKFASLSSFGTALGNVGKEGINAFIESFENSESKIEDTGKGVLNTFLGGIKAGTKSISETFTSVMNRVVTTLNNYYLTFYACGAYLVSGFANGISANTWMAEAQARIMARAAATAAEEELDEESPSKVGYHIGDFFGTGFVNGIAENIKNAYNSSAEMAKSAKTGLSNAISNVMNTINSGMDMQPTIRPVLDLTDVSSGVNAIGGMLDLNPSIGVMSNVRAVNSMMNSNQNGANDDVVSAINKLGDLLSNRSGDTYQFNGFSYNDGSDVADALQTLVRAAKMGRRM